MSFILLPMNIVIPAFYAANTAVSLVAIGMVSGIARFFDAFTDPLVGYLSDRTKTAIGPRKPWLLVGAVILLLSVFKLFQPPADADLIYYVIWSSGVFLGFTFYEIPNRAWASELSHDYFQRSRISSYVSAFAIVGNIIFWTAPFALAPLQACLATPLPASPLPGPAQS